MPVVSRLDWIVRQLQMGRSGHVVVGPAQDPLKLKVKIVLQPPSLGALSIPARIGVEAVLAHVRQMATQHVAVDRGHKHSSGLSEVAIWIRMVSNSSGGNSISIGNDFSQGGNGNSRDRGRSPFAGDRGTDPWHSGSGDPWGNAGTRPTKFARQHQLGYTNNNRSGSSTTPDPPSFSWHAPLQGGFAKTICLDREIPKISLSMAAETQESCKSLPDTEEFDPISLLSGMAGDTHDVLAGACITQHGIDTPLAEEVEGDSLVNVGLKRRQQCGEIVSNIIAVCGDESWRLQHDDIVYIGTGSVPRKVYRIGYGDYEREVRVAGLQENTSLWSTGQWVSTADCYKLERGDRLQAMRNCLDASQDENLLEEGSRYLFRGIDKDGDFILATPQRQYTIFYEDLDHFTLL